jgi:hypothetical protein
MKILNKLFIFSTVLLAATSCNKVLDKRDLSAMSGEQVFNDSVLARTYVDYIYDQNLPGWGGTWGISGNLSEETSGDSKYFEGTLLVNDVADFGTKLDANSNYGKIRVINNYLQEIEKGSLNPSWKSKLKAQAYFFRAWRYFELVKLYGGVPLVLTPQAAVGTAAKEEAFMPRNKTSECIAQISKDLDEAIANLPGKWTDGNDWGRVTSGTAAALKGRVLQYWASPQFNPADQADRWQAAYDASKLAKTTLLANGFGLNTSFDNLWFQERNNPEAVFVTGYNNLTGDQVRKNNTYDNTTRPAIAGTGGGSNQPSKELVDAFPMKDGKKINGGSKYTYDPQLFYKNRDPRFDKTIAYNGASWQLNGVTSRYWTYFAANKSVEKTASNTGFYTRKAINPTVAAGDVQYSGTDWIEIRFAEVLLNLAEAACGVNKLDEAYTELKAIRQRAGIEAGADGLYGLQANMTRAEMFNAILDERLVEFAFEGKRFWDLRRWKLFESKLNGKKRNGVIINLKTTAPADFATQREAVNLDVAYTDYFQIVPKVLDTRYAINWKPEYYFFALPQQAIDNNPQLQQTKGWNAGAFDPLQ